MVTKISQLPPSQFASTTDVVPVSQGTETVGMPLRQISSVNTLPTDPTFTTVTVQNPNPNATLVDLSPSAPGSTILLGDDITLSFDTARQNTVTYNSAAAEAQIRGSTRFLGPLIIDQSVRFNVPTTQTAGAGSATLPPNPAGFFTVKDKDGIDRTVAYYLVQPVTITGITVNGGTAPVHIPVGVSVGYAVGAVVTSVSLGIFNGTEVLSGPDASTFAISGGALVVAGAITNRDYDFTITSTEGEASFSQDFTVTGSAAGTPAMRIASLHFGANWFPNGQGGSTPTVADYIAKIDYLAPGGVESVHRIYDNGVDQSAIPVGVAAVLARTGWIVGYAQGSDLTVGSPTLYTSADALNAVGALIGVEGPNEANNSLEGGGTDLTAAQALAIQQQIYARYHPQGVTVLATSLADTGGNYPAGFWGGDIAAAAASSDLYVGHHYPNSGSSAHDMSRRTVLLTEAGLSPIGVADEYQPGLYNVGSPSEAWQAYDTITALLIGIKYYGTRALVWWAAEDYLGLQNPASPLTGLANTSGYDPASTVGVVGLFRDYDVAQPRGAAMAIHALFSLCRDISANRHTFDPPTRNITITGLPDAWADDSGILAGGGQTLHFASADGVEYYFYGNVQDELDLVTTHAVTIDLDGTVDSAIDYSITNPNTDTPIADQTLANVSSVVSSLVTEWRVLILNSTAPPSPSVVAITLAGGPGPVVLPFGSPPGTLVGAIGVTMSDGSTFSGTLARSLAGGFLISGSDLLTTTTVDTPLFDDEFTSAPWLGHETWQVGDRWSYIATDTPEGRGGTHDNEAGSQYWPNPRNINTPAPGLYSVNSSRLQLALMNTPSGIQAYIDAHAGEHMPYIGVLMNNQNTLRRSFGYYEVSVAVEHLPGFCFQWTLEDIGPWTSEIDVVIGGTPGGVHQIGLAFSGNSNAPASFAPTFVYTAPITVGQHIFGVDWQPDFIRFYVDAVQVYEIATATATANYGGFETAAMFTYMLTAANYQFCNVNPDPARLPKRAFVEYDRVYANKSAALSPGTYTEAITATQGSSSLTTNFDIILAAGGVTLSGISLSNARIPPGLTPPIDIGTITVQTTGGLFSGTITGSDTVNLQISPSNTLQSKLALSLGTLRETITATMPGAGNSPLSVPFDITVASNSVGPSASSTFVTADFTNMTAPSVNGNAPNSNVVIHKQLFGVSTGGLNQGDFVTNDAFYALVKALDPGLLRINSATWDNDPNGAYLAALCSRLSLLVGSDCTVILGVEANYAAVAAFVRDNATVPIKIFEVGNETGGSVGSYQSMFSAGSSAIRSSIPSAKVCGSQWAGSPGPDFWAAFIAANTSTTFREPFNWHRYVWCQGTTDIRPTNAEACLGQQSGGNFGFADDVNDVLSAAAGTYAANYALFLGEWGLECSAGSDLRGGTSIGCALDVSAMFKMAAATGPNNPLWGGKWDLAWDEGAAYNLIDPSLNLLPEYYAMQQLNAHAPGLLVNTVVGVDGGGCEAWATRAPTGTGFFVGIPNSTDSPITHVVALSHCPVNTSGVFTATLWTYPTTSASGVTNNVPGTSRTINVGAVTPGVTEAITVPARSVAMIYHA